MLVRLGHGLSLGQMKRRIRVRAARRSGVSFIAAMPAIGCEMIVAPQQSFSWMYVRGNYEMPLVRYVKRTIRPGMVCVDIGANVGYFTLLLAKLVGPTGRVIAFEPTETTCRFLRANVLLNELHNVTVEQLAVCDREGPAVFYEGSAGYDAYNSLKETRHPGAREGEFGAEIVGCVKLDSYLKGCGDDRVDFVKLDIEGAELLALSGFRRGLNANPGLRLAIEFADQTTASFGYSSDELATWLARNGWNLKVLDKRGRPKTIAPRQQWRGQMVVAQKDR